MFMRRRRPLLRAAMVGGAGYMAGKHGAQASEAEAEQDQRISSLEQQQQPPEQAAPVQQAPAAAPKTDIVGKLKELSGLRDAGALSPQEFEAAKGKLLGTA